MAFDPKRTRRILLAVAAVLFAVVVGFYSYARWKVNRELSKLPEKLGVEVQQSTAGFTFTKSDNGRKQFSISADKAIQYKAGQKASLKNVRILVYGRGLSGENADVYDRIYGDEFEYDPKSGEVRATGIVDIDLEHHGEPTADPMQEHVEPGSIHLKATGLSFNQKSGIAETKEKIEFSLPQATGSAIGARYDSKERTLTLMSDVDVTTSATAGREAQNTSAVRIRAKQAVITDAPRRAELSEATIRQGSRSLIASTVLVFLRPNSTVEHIDAQALSARDTDPTSPSEVSASTARFHFGEKNVLQNVVLTGNVSLESNGANQLRGLAQRADVTFATGNVVNGIRASGGVNFTQNEARYANHSMTVQAPAVEFAIVDNMITSATSSGGSAQLALSQPQSKTVVTAETFTARFAPGNRIRNLRGAKNVHMTFADAQGAVQRVTASDEVIARFGTNGSRSAQLEVVEQNGNFHYSEGLRKASAQQARYVQAEETIVATGNPRFEDATTGLAVSADILRFHRRTNSVDAENNVKTTYSSDKPRVGGALLASADPVHVTSQRATASSTGKARFVGNARLWQGASIIEADAIEFDRAASTVTATAGPNQKVQVNFTQSDSSGKQIPLTITGGKLFYSDLQRKARFTERVQASGRNATVTAREMEVLLKQRSKTLNASGGQLDQIIASGSVHFDQRNPARTADGERLVFFADSAKYVLTAEQGKTCSIFDAEHGKIEAVSLTFYSRDDTVQVGSGENTRVVTRTQIKENPRP